MASLIIILYCFLKQLNKEQILTYSSYHRYSSTIFPPTKITFTTKYQTRINLSKYTRVQITPRISTTSSFFRFFFIFNLKIKQFQDVKILIFYFVCTIHSWVTCLLPAILLYALNIFISHLICYLLDDTCLFSFRTTPHSISKS